MDVFDLHLHQPSTLPGVRRLWDRKAAASHPQPLGEAGAVAFLGGLFFCAQQYGSIDAVWK
jgi:hypothetical protein